MIKKSLYPVALSLLIMFLLAGCGGGAGSSSAPGGVNAAVPSIVQLLPVQQVVQTNSSISLRAKVLDGNGVKMGGVPVVFTNLSVLGALSSTTAKTDSQGFATVSIFSTDPGFATIQAEVNTGSGKVRDRKTVFFSLFDLFLAPPSGGQLIPTLTLAVDSNNDGSYNDPSDFFLSSGEGIVRATVLDETGSPVLNDTVAFGADSTELTFPDGAAKQTDSAGQAFARVKVVPSEIRNFDTPVNVSAVSANTGAFNVITLFLTPIEVGGISVTANPSTIASAGTSTVSATVTTTAGTFVPDGTAVNFTATGGVVAPFGQTTKGVATAQYTAPTLAAGSPDQTFTIDASSGGKSASTQVTITAASQALRILPASISVDNTIQNNLVFTISGGQAPYIVSSTDPTRAFNTSTLNVTVPLGAATGAVTLNVTDATGAATASAVITVVAPPLRILPATIAVANTKVNSLVFTITGGNAPYLVTSTNPLMAFNPATGNGLWSNVTSTINVTVPLGATAGAVTLNVTDATGAATASAVITVVEPPAPVVVPPTPAPALVVEPASVTFKCGVSSTAIFTITSGTPSFKAFKVLNTDPVSLGGALNPDGSLTIVGGIGAQFTVTNTFAPAVCPATAPPDAIVNVLDGAAKLFAVTIKFEP
jgi:hypothetical protein